MMGIVSLFIDVSIAILLVAVIVYCVRLNRNIRILQDSRSDMAKLFAEFDASIAKAAKSVTELQESAKESDQFLKDKLDKANIITNNLAFIIERGNKMADQLENGLKSGRTATTEAKSSASAESSTSSFSSRASQKSSSGGERPSPSARTTASIESVLEQIANRNNPAGNAEKKSNTRIRSRAEQELFNSLKSGR